MSAKVFLAGAGPGDPELLTLKTHRLLQDADIILHDSLVGPAILSFAKPGATLIDVGKRCGQKSAAQTTINELLIECARTGKLVLRLKGGDPGIFGRAAEEMAALNNAGIDYELIPGVTAATAAAATLKLSLTKRQTARTLHFLTGHGAEGGLPAHDWAALARAGGTLAIYMGAQTAPGLAAHLIEAGMPPQTPAIAVENASLPTQRQVTATLATLPRLLRHATPNGPLILLLGQGLSPDIPPSLRPPAKAGGKQSRVTPHTA